MKIWRAVVLKVKILKMQWFVIEGGMNFVQSLHHYFKTVPQGGCTALNCAVSSSLPHKGHWDMDRAREQRVDRGTPRASKCCPTNSTFYKHFILQCFKNYRKVSRIVKINSIHHYLDSSIVHIFPQLLYLSVKTCFYTYMSIFKNHLKVNCRYLDISL